MVGSYVGGGDLPLTHVQVHCTVAVTYCAVLSAQHATHTTVARLSIIVHVSRN